MTEIPEHLLKRSKAARAQAEGATPAAEPAAPGHRSGRDVGHACRANSDSRAAPAAPVGPPPPKPDIPVVAAAKARKKIPFWAFATLSTLPLWAFMYVRALTPTTETIPGPLGDGAALQRLLELSRQRRRRRRSATSSRRGGAQDLSAHRGSAAMGVRRQRCLLQPQESQIYGDPNRAGGAHVTKAEEPCPAGMGGQLTDAQILAVVCHERFTLGGADPVGANEGVRQLVLCRFSGVDRLGGRLGDLRQRRHQVPGAIEVGTEPAPGSPAGT